MQSIFGERERPNWCVGVSAVTMQHHESTACMNIDSLHERVDRLHEGISDNIGRVMESVCVSHAWCMYVPITHQYTSLHRLPSLSCPPYFLYHPSSGRWSLWCIIHLFHVAYMFFTDAAKKRGRWSLWCIANFSLQIHEHATTGWAGKEGQLWLCCNG